MSLWPLYSDSPKAQFFSAVITLLMTLKFSLVGLGVMKDPKLVAGATVSEAKGRMFLI
jgi:hypothetical protein